MRVFTIFSFNYVIWYKSNDLPMKVYIILIRIVGVGSGLVIIFVCVMIYMDLSYILGVRFGTQVFYKILLEI